MVMIRTIMQCLFLYCINVYYLLCLLLSAEYLLHKLDNRLYPADGCFMILGWTRWDRLPLPTALKCVFLRIIQWLQSAGLTKLIAGAMLRNSRRLVEQAERK